MDIMVASGGRLVLSPTGMLGVPGDLLGARPLFVAYGLSESLAIRMVAGHLLPGPPRTPWQAPRPCAAGGL